MNIFEPLNRYKPVNFLNFISQHCGKIKISILLGRVRLELEDHNNHYRLNPIATGKKNAPRLITASFICYFFGYLSSSASDTSHAPSINWGFITVSITV